MILDIFDPKAPPKPIGIDLGTTNSIVSYVRQGRPVAITNCDGTELLPSVVHYGPRGSVIVGGTAQSYLEREPERTIKSVKRFMGRGADDEETKKLGAYRFRAPQNDQERRQVAFDVGDRVVTPVEVSAEILKSLAQSARDQLQTLGGAVITVPAYFDDAQRQATKDAARIAGVRLLRLLNEPTAAALAYGLDKRQNGTFAVYDLGGGTFDVSILLLEDGVFQVKSTGGDSALGGDDMDRALAERLLTEMGVLPSQAPPELVGLALQTARNVKHALSERDSLRVELPRRGGGQTTVTVGRGEFEAMIAPLLERTARVCRRALRDAGLEPQELDGVILVGGATRVPAVRRAVAELFGREPLSDIDPDLVVAHGAALQAELLSSGSDEVLLLDVLPLSLGIETMGGAIDKILPRNTAIPTGAKATFTTFADQQTGFELHVVQGEREMAEDCRSLARFTLKGIPPMPAGHARLEVHFTVDENGLLQVTAREVTSGVEQHIVVQPSYGLDDDQVEAMLIAALDHGGEDFERRRLADAKVEGERLLLATQKAFDADADLLAADERTRIEQALEALRTAIRSGSARELQAAIDDLDHVTHDWAGRRMDRAIQGAIAGRGVDGVLRRVENARGVDAHVAEHATAGASPDDGVQR
jgi:molecular chaperone HscA